MTTYRGKREAGFTLIELMVVVIIAGVLAAIAVPTYSGYVRKATTTEATSYAGAIWGGVKIYLLDHAFPTEDVVGDSAIRQKFNVDISDAVYYDYKWQGSDTSIVATGKSGTKAEGVTVTFKPYGTTPDTKWIITGL